MTGRYDLLVVGAGPGRSSTVHFASSAGLETLLIDPRNSPATRTHLLRPRGAPWRRPPRTPQRDMAKEQHTPSAQEGLSVLCVEVYVNDRGAFLFAEHDERDSFGRPYGKGYGLVEEVVVVRDFSLCVVRKRVYRYLLTSSLRACHSRCRHQTRLR
jgi:hypothetical protein